MVDPQTPAATGTCVFDALAEPDATAFGAVLCHCSEDDGVPDVGVSVGLGDGKLLWLGELRLNEGGDIGLVFLGPDQQRVVAPLWPHCEWQNAVAILRHQVGPALAAQRQWRPINQPPAKPCNALLICAPFEWHDQEGNPVPLEPMRDELERMELAFWDGEMWCEAGTGHDIVHEERAPHLMPTFWTPLPCPPAPAGAA